jgi:hypothetical protein
MNSVINSVAEHYREILNRYDFIIAIRNPSDFECEIEYLRKQITSIVKTYNVLIITKFSSNFFCYLVDCNIEIIISGDDYDNLMMLYSMYEFSNKVVILAFDDPPGRKLRHLLDGGVATMKEIIDVIVSPMAQRICDSLWRKPTRMR